MATLSYTTSTLEDQAIAHKRAKINTERAAQEPPLEALTTVQVLQLYVRERVENILAHWISEMRADEAPTLRQAFEAADDATKAQIKTLLGL